MKNRKIKKTPLKKYSFKKNILMITNKNVKILRLSRAD